MRAYHYYMVGDILAQLITACAGRLNIAGLIDPRHDQVGSRTSARYMQGRVPFDTIDRCE
jgi:hypothetical protein